MPEGGRAVSKTLNDLRIPCQGTLGLWSPPYLPMSCMFFLPGLWLPCSLPGPESLFYSTAHPPELCLTAVFFQDLPRPLPPLTPSSFSVKPALGNLPFGVI